MSRIGGSCRPVRLAAVATAGAWQAGAAACTLCHSPQAISVRARLLGPDLWLNGGAVLLPLLLLAALLVLVAAGTVGPLR